jgi:lysozyme family protein
MAFDNILVNTLKNEGGETTDSGGHTNFGVTQSTYDAVAPNLSLPKKNVKDLKYGEVRKVYEEEL